MQELGEANTTQSGTDAPQATLIANLLTAGIDHTQLRQRLTASGTTITASNAEHFLADANNNTLALADQSQALSTRYSYDVYGQSTQTTLSGTPSDNSQQYTGRENDGTGLMYYRARYYAPASSRFISEDPIGWASGQTNNYAYVGGDPISFVDPAGWQSVYTDSRRGTTTFNPAPYPGDRVTIPTSTSAAPSSAADANGCFCTPDVNWIPSGTSSKRFGPDGSYIDTGDPRGRDIHGGGSGLKDPFAPQQGWKWTNGCTRGQNADVTRLGQVISDFKKANPNVQVSYCRC